MEEITISNAAHRGGQPREERNGWSTYNGVEILPKILLRDYSPGSACMWVDDVIDVRVIDGHFINERQETLVHVIFIRWDT